MTYGHRLPQELVLQEFIPVLADKCSTSERARVINEAENVKRYLGRKGAEKIAFEEWRNGR